VVTIAPGGGVDPRIYLSVDGRNPANQLIGSSLSHYLQVLYIPGGAGFLVFCWVLDVSDVSNFETALMLRICQDEAAKDCIDVGNESLMFLKLQRQELESIE